MGDFKSTELFEYFTKGSALLVPGIQTTAYNYRNKNEYVFSNCGGYSWCTPFTLGLVSIGYTIDPTLTHGEIIDLLYDTSYIANSFHIINPVEYIATILDRVGRYEEANAMREEVKARYKYSYALINTDNLDNDQIKSIKQYLGYYTEEEIILVEYNNSNREKLVEELLNDYSLKYGTLTGIQVFGDIDFDLSLLSYLNDEKYIIQRINCDYLSYTDYFNNYYEFVINECYSGATILDFDPSVDYINGTYNLNPCCVVEYDIYENVPVYEYDHKGYNDAFFKEQQDFRTNFQREMDIESK